MIKHSDAYSIIVFVLVAVLAAAMLSESTTVKVAAMISTISFYLLAELINLFKDRHESEQDKLLKEFENELTNVKNDLTKVNMRLMNLR